MLGTSADDSSFAKPLITWIAIQLIALVIAAAQTRFWATAPRTIETLALDELLVAQFLFSCLLFPYLCRTWQSTLAIVIASLPMIAVAGMLAGIGSSTCLASWLNLSMWLIGLFFCLRILTTPNAQMIAVATIFSLNFTSIVMCYLTAEMKGAARCGELIPLRAAMIMADAPLWPRFLPAVFWLTCTALLTKFSASSYPQILSTRNA